MRSFMSFTFFFLSFSHPLGVVIWVIDTKLGSIQNRTEVLNLAQNSDQANPNYGWPKTQTQFWIPENSGSKCKPYLFFFNFVLHILLLIQINKIELKFFSHLDFQFHLLSHTTSPTGRLLPSPKTRTIFLYNAWISFYFFILSIQILNFPLHILIAIILQRIYSLSCSQM